LNGGNAALATNVVSGIGITNAFITNSVFAGNGANVTNLNASSLSSGTVPLAQLSGITSSQLNATTWQLATNLNGGNAALATNVISGIGITNAFITNSVFAGNGGGLTNLNATQLSSGTIPLAQLPAAMVTNTETGVTLGGTFNGNGANVTNLNASNLASGTIPLARLPGLNLTNVSGALPSGLAYAVGGNQTGGWGSPVMLVTNANTSANASPALRVVGYGTMTNGALSVSDRHRTDCPVRQLRRVCVQSGYQRQLDGQFLQR
jgi:hypothetical protein